MPQLEEQTVVQDEKSLCHDSKNAKKEQEKSLRE